SLLDPPAWAQPRPGRKSGAVDASAGVAALELLHRCDAVLEALSTAPASTLTAGGVGVRELRRAARAAGVARDDLALLLGALADSQGRWRRDPAAPPARLRRRRRPVRSPPPPRGPRGRGPDRDG